MCDPLWESVYQPLAFINFGSALKPTERPNPNNRIYQNHRTTNGKMLFTFMFILFHSISSRLYCFLYLTGFIYYLHCAHHRIKSKKQQQRPSKIKRERESANVYFHTEKSTNAFIDVLMNIKWVFIEINTIECVRRAICLLRLLKYTLTRTSAISVSACITFDFRHSAQRQMFFFPCSLHRCLKLCLDFDREREKAKRKTRTRSFEMACNIQF